MRSIRLTLLGAAAIGAVSIGAVSIGGAFAMPFGSGPAALGQGPVQNVRLVCDQYGRCYNTRRSDRAPRSYYAPRGYDRPVHYGGSYPYASHDYGYYGGPRVGIGIGSFGVGIGAW